MPTQKELKAKMLLREFEMSQRTEGIPIDAPDRIGGLNNESGDKDLQKRLNEWAEFGFQVISNTGKEQVKVDELNS